MSLVASQVLNTHEMSAIMARPELPPESVSKCTPTFQFPKSVLQPLIRPVTRLQDAGWLPAVKQKQHVVICGFPRSGTTLCQLMIEACVSGIKVFGRERRALEVARFGRRTHAEVVTKRPKDVYLIPEIREFYAAHSANVRFILMHRDPRAVLTSVHFSEPSRYFVSVSNWRHIFAHWKWARQLPDLLSVSYEDLVAHPENMESQITRLTGWKTDRPFRSFHKNVPNHFDGRALNGLRELDPLNLERWRFPEHRERVRTLLQDMPELPEVLIELGYERDYSWTYEYSDVRSQTTKECLHHQTRRYVAAPMFR